jgi:Na+/melibiose symporter-like transporter
MRKTVLTFGLISGAISAIMMLATIPFADKIGFEKSEIIGYTTIVLSALLVFFGVRSYRENVSGGRLTFGRGFTVGILITLLSNFCYVTTWEVVYFKFLPDFADKYAAHMIERAKASGASEEKIEKTTRESQQFQQMYKNPAMNVALTFAEVFPIGLAATLLSAAILRKKSANQPT